MGSSELVLLHRGSRPMRRVPIFPLNVSKTASVNCGIGKYQNRFPIRKSRISSSSENLPVARRTVAKYREQMKILPARLRQKYE